MKKKETLSTISKRTGFSVSTISRVLSGKAAQQRISQGTIDTIMREARKCDYSPNLLAKGLRTNSTGIVGLVIPTLENPFFANIAHSISEILRRDNIHLMIGSSMERPETEVDVIRSFISKGVDGIIVAPSSDSPDYFEELSRNVPVVLIDRYFKDTRLDFISCDNYNGGYMAAEHLIKKGYRKILVVQGAGSSMPNKERVRGFEDAVKSFSHLDISYRITGHDFSTENGYAAVTSAMGKASGDKPTAIFCLSVTIALGAIQALHETGVKINDDVGIITFDDNVFLDYLNPPMTRIAQPIGRICQLSCAILRQRMEDNAGEEPTQILIKPSLVRGGSC